MPFLNSPKQGRMKSQWGDSPSPNPKPSNLDTSIFSQQPSFRLINSPALNDVLVNDSGYRDLFGNSRKNSGVLQSRKNSLFPLFKDSPAQSFRTDSIVLDDHHLMDKDESILFGGGPTSPQYSFLNEPNCKIIYSLKSNIIYLQSCIMKWIEI